MPRSTRRWPIGTRSAVRLFDLNGSRINSLYASGQFDRGIAAAQALLKHDIARVGEKNYDTAIARANLAFGYMKANRDADAIREFQAAIPVLMAGARENADDDNSAAVAMRSDRLQSYRRSLYRLAQPRAERRQRRQRRAWKPSPWPTPSAAIRCSGR